MARKSKKTAHFQAFETTYRDSIGYYFKPSCEMSRTIVELCQSQGALLRKDGKPKASMNKTDLVEIVKAADSEDIELTIMIDEVSPLKKASVALVAGQALDLGLTTSGLDLSSLK